MQNTRPTRRSLRDAILASSRLTSWRCCRRRRALTRRAASVVSIRSPTIRFNCAFLFFQLPQARNSTVPWASVFLLPALERGFTDAELAVNLRNRGYGSRTAATQRDLRFGELRFFHGKSVRLPILTIAAFLYFILAVFCGRK